MNLRYIITQGDISKEDPMTHFLDNLLNPKSVAFLGASNNIMTMGTGQCYTLKSRFKGKIYVIHPSEEEVLGLPVFRKLSDLPEVPDLPVSE